MGRCFPNLEADLPVASNATQEQGAAVYHRHYEAIVTALLQKYPDRVIRLDTCLGLNDEPNLGPDRVIQRDTCPDCVIQLDTCLGCPRRN
jgi:hypothetical protein